VLHSVLKKFRKIITVEDGILKGGFGSAVIEFMCDNGYSAEIKRLGIPTISWSRVRRKSSTGSADSMLKVSNTQ